MSKDSIFSHVSLRAKALIAPVLFLLAAILMVGMAVHGFQSGILEQRRDTLRAVGQSALATLAHFAEAEKAGSMTHEMAEVSAKDALGRLRYNAGDYLSVYSSDGRIIVHPNASLVGRANGDLPPSVAGLVRDQLALVNVATDGFFPLLFPRSTGGVPVEKLNYVAKFLPWGWVIATGVYMDDVSATAWSYALRLGLVAMAALVVAGFFSWFVLAEFHRALRRVVVCMELIADGDTAVLVSDRTRRDEAGVVAGTLEKFRTALAEAAELRTRAAEAQAMAENERVLGEIKQAKAAAAQGFVVTSVATGFEQLAAGNLTFRLEQSFLTEYEGLRSNFNATIAQLQEMVRNIVTNTYGIRSGTEEIRTASDDLSRRTEQQAASLEETAAALDEITATVRNTAKSSKHVQAIVSRTKEGAEQSGEVVRQAVAAMGGIEQSSQKIGDIIGVIDEIAFQTNLLALNAGVEAARAGDAGRGFAVVASEVRALAQRSAQAAKEIKALISNSAQQVGAGVKLVGETGRALGRILSEVGEVTTAVSEIAASAQEQAAGLAEVNIAINQMDQVTQQNAAMVEQSTAASHSLAQQTAELVCLTERFQIGAAPSGVAADTSVQPLHRSANSAPRAIKPVSLKVVSRGGSAALRKSTLVPASAEESWTEF